MGALIPQHETEADGSKEATPDSVRAWLRETYSAQTIAGQPGHTDPRASALVAWCNATENLARGGQSKADREQSERYVREGVPYLP